MIWCIWTASKVGRPGAADQPAKGQRQLRLRLPLYRTHHRRRRQLLCRSQKRRLPRRPDPAHRRSRDQPTPGRERHWRRRRDVGSHPDTHTKSRINVCVHSNSFPDAYVDASPGQRNKINLHTARCGLSIHSDDTQTAAYNHSSADTRSTTTAGPSPSRCQALYAGAN